MFVGSRTFICRGRRSWSPGPIFAAAQYLMVPRVCSRVEACKLLQLQIIISVGAFVCCRASQSSKRAQTLPSYRPGRPPLALGVLRALHLSLSSIASPWILTSGADIMHAGCKLLQSTSSSLLASVWTSWGIQGQSRICLLYTSPSPRDLSTSRMPSSA